MEVKGKIIHDLGEQSGKSQAGNVWKKHEYVLETLDSRPRKVHFDFFGDRADQFVLKEGDDVVLSFDIESREYQGRWYTSIRGWKAEKTGNNSFNTSETGNYNQVNVPPIPTNFKEVPDQENEDLPF